MKKGILLLTCILSLILTSCYVESVEEHHYTTFTPIDTTPKTTINTLLNAYELWYVNINKTKGYGETPFLQMAFTISFKRGTVYANNNLVGIGIQGGGYGIPVGNYDAYGTILDIDHVHDGLETFDVYQINTNTIELYNPNNKTSYFLEGYQRHNFDYDYVFYDNIHYFLQEYNAWEKTFTSLEGDPNAFDYENYLTFLSGGSNFKSSKDVAGTNILSLIWDYSGVYNIQNIANNIYLKQLRLNYGNFNNDNFELRIIDDSTIELMHHASGTRYEFTGRGYTQYSKQSATKNKIELFKKRKQYTKKIANNRAVFLD